MKIKEYWYRLASVLYYWNFVKSQAAVLFVADRSAFSPPNSLNLYITSPLRSTGSTPSPNNASNMTGRLNTSSSMDNEHKGEL